MMFFKHFLSAIQLLTIIPLRISFDRDQLEKSVLYFVPVGFLIGAILLGSHWISKSHLHPAVLSSFLLLIWIFITGAIHLDGFVDTMDGLYAGRTAEGRLKIMHDTTAGSIGVVSVIILLLMKFSLLYSNNPPGIWQVLLITPAWSRWGMALACCLFPYAKEEGKGKIFVEGARKWYILPQGIVLVILSLFLLGWKTFYIPILLSLFIYLFGLLLRRKIGGITGDTIGAMNEIGEVLTLLCISLIQCIPL